MIKKGAIQLLVNGETRFSARFNEPRFDHILETNLHMIEQAVCDNLFHLDGRITTPINPSDYYHKSYASIDDWLNRELTFCADTAALRAFADQMRPLIPIKHDTLTIDIEVREHYRDHHFLLCKV